MSDGQVSHVTVDERFFMNADCWFEVCRFLNYRSRVRCEVASTRLATLLANFWRTIRCLDVNTVPLSAIAIIAVSAKVGTSLRCFKMRDPMSAAVFNAVVNNCPHLHTVDIHVGDELPALHSLTELKELNLIGSCTDILEYVPPMLERVTGLRGVRVDERLRSFFTQHRYLTNFEMTKCGGTLSIFDVIAENCPLMRCIAAVECDVRLDGVERLANLKELKLSKSSAGDCFLTEEQMWGIFTKNVGLESVRVAGVDRKLGRECLAAFSMLRRLEELEILCYRETGVFTDVELRVIFEAVGQTLRRLSLVGGAVMSREAVDAIIEFCPNLRLLVVNLCSYAVSAGVLRRLVDGFSAQHFELFYANPTLAQAGELAELGARVRRFESSEFVAHTILNEL